VYHLIERVVGPLGLRVDESCLFVDARLPDGSRFHAVIPPLSLCGPVVTVGKFGINPPGRGRPRLGTAPRHAFEFLGACVRGRANLLVSGGAASGKTTLLGVLSAYIPEGERIVTIEDAAELRLAQPHVVRLEARPATVEGRGGTLPLAPGGPPAIHLEPEARGSRCWVTVWVTLASSYPVPSHPVPSRDVGMTSTDARDRTSRENSGRAQ
jgi:hypothetical protein